jgi:putative ABC transport system permease protein
MTRDPVWRRYLRFFGSRPIADLDDELRFHIDMRMRDFMSAGMTEAEARAATARRLGDLAEARHSCATIVTRQERRLTRTLLLDAFVQDVRFALRSLGRQKAWTIVAAITLALGIGATSAMFSVVNHLLLNPLPFRDANRIVYVAQVPSEGNQTGISITMTPMGRLVTAWREQSRSFETLEPYAANDVVLQRDGQPARAARSLTVLPSFTTFAGTPPLMGRMFTEAEAKGEATVALLGEGFWRSEFGGDRELMGKTLAINERPVTVIGVMPSNVVLPQASDAPTDVWLPLDLVRQDDDGFHLLGRLRPGVTRDVAARELDTIARRSITEGNSARYNTMIAAPGELLRFQDSLVMLSVAVALVLLIACANVAHLLLARGTAREREMAIRTALGAGTGRLFRLLVAESLVLAVVGCLAGAVVATLGLRLLVAARPESLAELGAARVDGTTLLVTVIIAVITGIVFGVVGAWQASRHARDNPLKGGSLTSTLGRRQGRARGILVVTEMALSTALLIGAALLLRSVMHLQSREMGFNPAGVYSVEVQLSKRYTRPLRAAFFNELAARVRELPGVASVTQIAAPPPSMAFLVGALQIEGEADPPLGTTGFIPYGGVGPEFFRLMEIRLAEGTHFTDTSATSVDAIVNEGFARKHWPGQSPIGHRIRVVYNGQGQWKTIVGVAANTLTQGLTRDPSEPIIYMPGTGVFQPSLLLRVTDHPGIVQAVAGLARSLDPRLPPPKVKSVEAAMQKSIARPRFTMFLLLVFTVVAVGLAAVGLYGVLAYSVARRTREIGIRFALGASAPRVARTVMSHALLLAGAGIAIGLVAARWGARLVGNLLYGVQQTDTTSFVLGAGVLLVVAGVACLVPLRRAMAVDPLIAMRVE